MVCDRRNSTKIILTTMLKSSSNKKSGTFDMMEVIVDTKCQLKHLHLEYCFIQQNQEHFPTYMSAFMCLYFS